MPQHPLFSIHPAVAYVQKIIENLPKTTGKSLQEWLSIVEKSGPKEEKERFDWLKTAHQLGGTTAGLIAETSVGKNHDWMSESSYLQAADEYIEKMYADKKAALRPIHDALIALGKSLAADVKICPCETIVPLYRNHVIAQIKPATNNRIDFGLALKGVAAPLSPRLIDTGGLQKKDRITHRFAISSIDDIDEEVRRWFGIAYDLDAK